MYTNGTYTKIVGEYTRKSHRVHLPTPKTGGYIDDDTKDRLEDRKFDGGYDTKSSNICKVCFITKSTNGTCSCL